MKTKPFFLLTTCAALFALAPPALAKEEPAPSKPEAVRVAWEHCAFTHKLSGDGAQTKAEVARTINGLGTDGWELVSVANIHENGTTKKTVYYFKRPL